MTNLIKTLEACPLFTTFGFGLAGFAMLIIRDIIVAIIGRKR